MEAGIASPRIIGRQDELATLQAALRDAIAGAPSTIIVTGPSGVGKSRLVGEFADRARSAGALVLVGDCLDVVGGGLAFGPLIAILREAAREVPAEALPTVLGPARNALATLLPELATRPIAGPVAGRTARHGRLHQGGHEPSTDDPDRDDTDRDDPGAATRLLEHVLGVLGRLADDRPAVVVLEDVQWIDRATRDLVTFLARSLRSERLLLLLTFRSEHLPRRDPLAVWLTDLRRAPRVTAMSLAPLSVAETGEQIAAILGTVVAADLAARVHQRSEGNPLFTEELLAAIRAGSEALPADLSDALLAAVGRLPTAAADVLAVAAVAARPFDERFVAAVLGGAESDFLEPIRQAVVGQVLVAGADAYRFRHGLFAEAISTDLTPGERRGLHARIAAALDSHPDLGEGGQEWAVGESADHWLAAGRLDAACRRSIEAALAAGRIHAHAIAFARWEQALGIAERLEPDRWSGTLDAIGIDEPTALARAAQAASLSGAHERAIALVERARTAVDPALDAPRSGVLAAEHGRILWTAGHFPAALDTMHVAVDMMASVEGSADWARVISRYATLMLFQDHAVESTALARRAVDAARAAGLRGVEAQALDALGNGLWLLGATTEAVERLTEARRAALDSDSVEESFFAADSLAECLVDADRFTEALAVAESGEEAARHAGLDRLYGAMFRGNAGMALFALGRWAEADTRTDHDIDAGHGRVWAMSVRARVLAGMGRVAEGRSLVAVVEALFPEGLPDLARLELALPTAELDLADGRADAAMATVEAALAARGRHVAIRLGLAAAGLRAAADAAADGRARRDDRSVRGAVEAGERLLAEVSAQGAMLADWDPPTPSKLATAALADAEATRLAGRPDAAAWSAVVDAFERVPMPWLAAYARYRQAEALLQIEGVKSPGAGDLLRAAHETAQSLGAMPLAADVERLARHARVSLGPDGTSAAPAPAEARDAGARGERRAGGRRATGADRPADLRLSARERQVLTLVADGRTNGQIALDLFISPKTASVHVTHILNKLGASNRVEAALIAARAGLLDEYGDSDGA